LTLRMVTEVSPSSPGIGCARASPGEDEEAPIAGYRS
jgi:hypothetical protein